MKEIFVKTGKPYSVKIGAGESSKLAEYIKQVKICGKIAVITDDIVGNLYGESVVNLLDGYDVCEYRFKHGERHKSMDTVADILEFLAANKLTRSDLIVALGGGIVGDVAGYAAASYLRGIDFVQVPTTLLAMVDSSVGGKTGVNLAAGKNLAGAFHQPLLVVCDPDFLKTLPSEEFKNGLGEVIKYGCIADEKLFCLLEKGDIADNLAEAVYRCIDIKRRFVEEDEFDKGERQKLNFGHTLGHAVESITRFAVPHGQAVGVGMRLICLWAEDKGLTKKGCADRIDGLLKKYGMTDCVDASAADLWKAAAVDKKLKGDRLTLVLVKDIGQCFLHTVDINYDL